ncbi:Virulence protein [Burkholderia multivorans]|nr:Virulence protein [Burkholderia multivorans]MDR9180647.1 Virulence protein [Burkholderia multivorans]MDR9185508.1 Virulence protein [Burkholderia multivorans]MDR9190604.1 Virulence protein [Burkholderia multivorans]MDR9196475.1 Virulence protein [Burkholderia multivorans]
MTLIDRIDHLVLTCVDPERTRQFYVDVLQMRLETFGAGRIAFRFGNQKINPTCVARSSSRKRTCRCRARSICV